MKTPMKFKSFGAGLVTAAVASILAGCAATPVTPAGALDARAADATAVGSGFGEPSAACHAGCR